jgi:eight-cysteine-cluster-containing protein
MAVAGCLWLLAACGFDGEPAGSSKETSRMLHGNIYLVAESDEYWAQFEEPESPGECAGDVDCSAAGCSAEVCTTAHASPDVVTVCAERHPGKQFYCGCIETRCRWQAD